jgi:hypothetical protein
MRISVILQQTPEEHQWGTGAPLDHLRLARSKTRIVQMQIEVISNDI